MVTRTYPHNDEFNDYLLRSGEQIALGNFSDEVTLLGTGGQVLAGASGVDFLMDARDIGYDVVNWEWSWRHAGKTTIDIVAIVPVVGALKYSDEVSALVKGTAKRTSKAVFKSGRITSEAIEANAKMFSGKTADEIAKMLTSEGYDVTVRTSTRSRSGAQIIQINNAGKGRNITQMQVSPGGGRHGGNPYVKISTSDQGIFKIVDGLESNYITDGLEKAKIIFTGGK